MELEWEGTEHGCRLIDTNRRWIVLSRIYNVVTGWECLVASEGHKSFHPTKEEAMAMAVAIVRMK